MVIKRKDLSEEQELAFQYVVKFTESTDRQMILYGSAGCGKTVLLNCLIDYLEETTDLEMVCTAPTNEAVRVIAEVTNRDYDSTIYSLMGLVLYQEDDREPKIVAGGESQLDEFDLIFIDESSMIDREMYELIQNELAIHSRVKVVYIGDSAQLPPVKDKGSDSLVFNVKNKIGLNTVQRIANDNPIIEVVTLIRNNLNSTQDVFDRITKLLEDGKSGIEFIDDKEQFLQLLCADFLSDQFKTDDNYVRVAAYTNKTVNAMNTYIRRKIYNTKELPEFMKDEKIIVGSPVIKVRKGKGKQTFKEIVYSVGERIQICELELKIEPEFGFKYWELMVVNYKEKKFRQVHATIKVVHKEYTELYKKVLVVLAQEAKESLRTKNEFGKFPSKGEAWSPFYKMKEEYTTVKYKYCSTTHQLQGTTVKNIYVIENDMDRLTWNNSERNKLKYVAFTRASKLLRIYR